MLGTNALAAIHGGTGQNAAYARLAHSATHGIHMPATGFGKAGNTGLYQLKAAGKRRDMHVLFSHGKLVRPCTVVQPCEQIYIVPKPAPQLLAEMHMGVHQPRKHHAPADIHHLCSFRNALFRNGTNGLDDVVFHQNIAAFEHLAPLVHGKNQTIAQ